MSVIIHNECKDIHIKVKKGKVQRGHHFFSQTPIFTQAQSYSTRSSGKPIVSYQPAGTLAAPRTTKVRPAKITKRNNDQQPVLPSIRLPKLNNTNLYQE